MPGINQQKTDLSSAIQIVDDNLATDICQLRLPNTIDSLYLAERLIESVSKQLKIEVAKISFVSLAVSEALCNSIQYGFSKGERSSIALSVQRTGELMTVVLEDRGVAVPAKIIEQYQSRDVNMPKISIDREELPVSGWGVNLVLMATASVRYERREHINRLEMDFTLIA